MLGERIRMLIAFKLQDIDELDCEIEKEMYEKDHYLRRSQ